MFGTSQPPAAAPASIALAPAAMPLGGGAAADAGANGGGTPTYSRYASLYAATNGMSSLSLDGWGGAPAAADPYAASSIFAPSGLAAEPAGGLAAAGQGLGLGSGAGSAAALAQSGSPTGSGSLNQDDVRTIFVSGFPPDVRDRELHNLLRYLPGYEACQLAWKAGEPQGFALFTSPAAARFAVELIAGTQFDEANALRAEMARKNMYLRSDDPSIQRATQPSPLLSPDQLVAAAAAAPPAVPAPPSPAAAAAAASAAGGSAGLLPSPRGAGSPAGLSAGLVPRHLKVPMRPQSFSPVTNLRDNPPCNTLFVGNLGDSVSEAELRALMSSQPGYRQMKVVKGSRNTTAFVEFTNVASAMLVHQTLQGAVLQSSDRGGVRLQFSKNPFGRRDDCARDQGGAPAQAQAHAAAAAAAMSAAAAGGGAGAAARLAHAGLVAAGGALGAGGAAALGHGAVAQLGGVAAGQLPGLAWAALPYDQSAAAAAAAAAAHQQLLAAAPHAAHQAHLLQHAGMAAFAGLGHGLQFTHAGLSGAAPPGL